MYVGLLAEKNLTTKLDLAIRFLVCRHTSILHPLTWLVANLTHSNIQEEHGMLVTEIFEHSFHPVNQELCDNQFWLSPWHSLESPKKAVSMKDCLWLGVSWLP